MSSHDEEEGGKYMTTAEVMYPISRDKELLKAYNENPEYAAAIQRVLQATNGQEAIRVLARELVAALAPKKVETQ